jgi:glycosyltransferase involved in cell wall biosynthesis
MSATPPLASSASAQLPRRVLHVETGRHLYGGAQQVVHLVTGLVERGIESLLVCAQGSDIGRALASIAQVHELPLRGDLDWRLASRLSAIVRTQRPDLVHLHSRRGADLFGGLAARYGRLPVVLSRRVDTPEARWLVPLKYRLFDRVVAISHGIERVLASAGVPQAKLRCVPSGIDPAPYRQPVDRGWLCREFGLSPDDQIVGHVAQFIPRKGHSVLLDAVDRLRGKLPRLRVLLFGRGPLETTLQAEIVGRNLQEFVRLVGFRTDLPRVIPGLDLVVHPALAEGLGVALIQAAAAGVAMVGTRAGGIPEIVRDGENGILVNPGSVSELAGAIERLLGDPALRQELGRRGQALVDREFTHDAMVNGNLAVYRELLAERATRRGKSAA